MPESKTFTREKMDIVGIFSSVKLTIPAGDITHEQFKDFVRHLRTSYSKYFGRAEPIFDEGRGRGFIHVGDKRNISIDPMNIQYTESQKFNEKQFNDISLKRLYTFFSEVKGVESTDFKLAGKVYNLLFRIGSDNIEFLQNRFSTLRDESLSLFLLRATAIREDINIHISLQNKQSEEDEEDEGADQTILVKLDFNNRDQISGVSNDLASKIFEFADSFYKDQMIDFLNNNFGMR